MEEIAKFNDFIKTETSWIDFEVNRYGLDEFKIIGSEDFSYGHIVELTFKEIQYVQIRDTWTSESKLEHGVLKLLVNDEREKIVDLYGIEKKFKIFQISTEDYGDFIICATSLVIDYTRVFYYMKDHLLENEKIADWVKKVI